MGAVPLLPACKSNLLQLMLRYRLAHLQCNREEEMMLVASVEGDTPTLNNQQPQHKKQLLAKVRHYNSRNGKEHVSEATAIKRSFEA